MNTIVMKLSDEVKRSLLSNLASNQVPNKNPYVRFAAKVQGVTVLLYTSGKCVFQGSQAEQIANQFGYTANTLEDNGFSGQDIAIIGSDEVGNGSYFGGLAVVASFVAPNNHGFLKSLGVDDSKKIGDIKIRQIAPILEERIPHKSLLLSPKRYNQVVGNGKEYNAISVKVALHNQAIYLLLQDDDIKPDKIVIDAFTSRKNYEKYLKNESNQFSNPLTFEEKAEGKYLAVAVSSIIARNLFLENLDKLSQETGYKLPSGAGNKSNQVASQILAAYGMSALEHTAKLHFANTQKAQNLLKK